MGGGGGGCGMWPDREEVGERDGRPEEGEGRERIWG